MMKSKKKTATDAATPMTAINGEIVVEHLTNNIISHFVNTFMYGGECFAR